MYGTLYFCQILMKFESSRQICEKSSNVISNEYQSSGSLVVLCGRTERHIDTTKLIIILIFIKFASDYAHCSRSAFLLFRVFYVSKGHYRHVLLGLYFKRNVSNVSNILNFQMSFNP